MGSLNLWLLAFFSGTFLFHSSYGQGNYQNSRVISSFSYPDTRLRPFDWRYMRVELPPWFSSLSMTLLSNVDIDNGIAEKLSKSTFPMVCFREGSPPLPDSSDDYLRNLEVNLLFNGSVGGTELCLFFQKNITVTLTNEQITSGVWYLGFFNGLGPARTQSKMISRGTSYLFNADITVEGCPTRTLWGVHCNQTLDLLFCTPSVASSPSRKLAESRNFKAVGTRNNFLLKDEVKASPPNSSTLMTSDNVIICKNSFESSCIGYGDSKLYSLEIVEPASHLKIIATDVRYNRTSTMNGTEGAPIMCYVRYNAMPLQGFGDYTGDISREPLVIELPKVGQWYILILASSHGAVQGKNEEEFLNGKICFSLEWQVHECPTGKAGLNCTWNHHILQRVLKKSSSLPYESYYLPEEEKMLIKSANFPVRSLLSNSSFIDQPNIAWTFFLLEVPRGAAGANIHLQLTSDARVSYGLYVRFGGIPSNDTWDYFINETQTVNGSMLLDFSDPHEGRINFYVLYAREGLWNFALRHPVSSSNDPILMSITLEGCPKKCSSHGTCHSAADESGLTLYSFCSCDRNHGGFDCSIELVSHQGHVQQSIALIASNAAAILPAFWALRRKALAEWVLFTSSGISSGLYHACDVGTWCALSFRVLQFMDFWLSFMAVVSTFVYMATIDEVSKRAIHTTVSILTALMAATGPTRSANIILVVAIGILGLIVGWIIEFSSTIRSIFCLSRFSFDVPERWQIIKRWLFNFIKTLRKRFQWHFIFLGFVALTAAGISWKLETSRSYWIWHSIWHVSIYTSSFFFLCSTSVSNSNQEWPQRQYELARQNSSSRGDLAETVDRSSVNRTTN
ncbi:hypothetical protein H6P81_017238 [Aristolochia fimbriata]|uniref:EGF-like domain-containing protein n=1 Tax=Aristolochia fimbriata TaxID=158543 RepID=A0AAV7DZD3_ARIFI|nr:hypothetical protein H6P81_017238 [Aristolochia fimbriata]